MTGIAFAAAAVGFFVGVIVSTAAFAIWLQWAFSDID